AGAAAELETLIEIPAEAWDKDFEQYARYIVPVLSEEQMETHAHLIESAQVVEIKDSGKSEGALKTLMGNNPDTMVMIKTALNENSPQRVQALAEAGADIIHVYADRNGNVDKRRLRRQDLVCQRYRSKGAQPFGGPGDQRQRDDYLQWGNRHGRTRGQRDHMRG
ncbi:MAG: hypothetical protein JRJ47_03180, partial [Deltaproteobacteria bacterium]|nr:hypothetical protein [Deltaproteobacteria bacterium]